jgi:site-specific DNA-methyltransferase (adenine-specific)
MKSEVFNMDCVEAMKGYPDNYFDLAIVDPPYGIKRFEKPSGKTRFSSSKLMQENGLTWDNKPKQEYWDELFRVSKNQIVWGANNFIMPPSEYFCIWNKKQTVDNFATAEYAWVSMGLKKPAKIFDYSIHKHNQTDKIHPTQKPVALYRWLLQNYAKEGDKILDTHLGSGSSRIAADMEGYDFTAYELDKDYFDASVKRFNEYKLQTKLL